MQVCLAEPVISQDSEKLRFQKSRKPQSTSVFSKSAGLYAPHQSVAPFRREESLRRFIHGCVFFQSHLSIRPDSPCHQLMEHGFGLPDGSISPGLKTFIVCVIEQPKQFCCADFAKAKFYAAFTCAKSGRSGSLYNVEVDYRNSRALKLHCQRQPNLAQASYVHYLVSLSEAAAFCTGGASEG